MKTKSILSYVEWIAADQKEMLSQVEAWSNINTSSTHVEGLKKQMKLLKQAFKVLNGKMEEISMAPLEQVQSNGKIKHVPLGKILSITKHPKAPIQVFLGGHMDTVFSPSSPFQACKQIDGNTLQGPGVADMKGGLAIMLKALEALEKSPWGGKIGWQVLINPDEEIGSVNSASFIREAAQHKQLGLLFEPAYPNGTLVSSRKGSANYTIVAQGKAAHVGRDFAAGHNAIVKLARMICEVNDLNDPDSGITVNVGVIKGGEAVNIVPDLASCRINIRAVNLEDFFLIKETLFNILATLNEHSDVTLTLYQQGERSPKIFDEQHRHLFVNLRKTSLILGAGIDWKPSGGVCDGNILFEAGVPSIDTLGAIGGNIHTQEEYILIDSLVQRAQLTALFLMQLESMSDANE